MRERMEFENYIIEYSLELEFAEKYWRDYHIGNFELKIYSIRENLCYDKVEFKDFFGKFGVYCDGVFDIFKDCFILFSKPFGEGLDGENSYELGKKLLKSAIENELSRKRIFFDGDFKFSVKV
jgi:hypothetical protein